MACQATNWSSYGYNDGLLGVPAKDRAGKFADCAKLGHPADIAAYQAARANGLAEYCTVENGYEVGRSGRPYHRVCPPELAQGFLQGYEQGRKERPVAIYPSVGFGFGFGFVLERSGFGRASVLAAQFYFTDMRVLKVMFSSIVTALVAIFGTVFRSIGSRIERDLKRLEVLEKMNELRDKGVTIPPRMETSYG